MPLEERTLKQPQSKTPSGGEWFPQSPFLLPLPCSVRILQGGVLLSFAVKVWGVHVCVFKCVCVDMPVFRSPLLQLCVLVTAAYCIRIAVVVCVDMQQV